MAYGASPADSDAQQRPATWPTHNGKRDGWYAATWVAGDKATMIRSVRRRYRYSPFAFEWRQTESGMWAVFESASEESQDGPPDAGPGTT